MSSHGFASSASPHAATQTRGTGHDTVACAGCLTANPADRKFCSACGASLRESCPKCQGQRLLSERFCGNCGLDVANFVTSQANHLDQQIVLARQLQAEAQFVDARRLVQEVARVDDPRFTTQARLATQLSAEFAADQKAQEQVTEQAVERARQLLREHAYDAAIQTLANIRAALDTPESNQLRSEATARQQEAETILAGIRDGLERKQALSLLPLVERFLALKPNHPQATKLAKQIADQVLTSARQAARALDWNQAFELLRAVPAFVLTDDMRKLAEECAERMWLAREVQHSSVLHPALPIIAERLIELNPGQQEFPALVARMRQRQSAGPNKAWQAVPDWSNAPPQSALGLPVDWLGGFVEIQIAETVTLPLPRPALSRLNVAIGLALQAIGKAVVDVNLSTAESKVSLLGRLANGFRKKGPLIGWGIDLSGMSLKAVMLRWDEATQKASIAACEVIEREPAIELADEAAVRGIQAEMLQLLASRQSMAGMRVAVNLPPLQSLAKLLIVPAVVGKKFGELLRFEARMQIPIALDDLSWDYVDFRGSHADADAQQDEAGSARALVLAAKRTVVTNRLELFVRAGIQPDIIQCDCVALHNYVQHDLADAVSSSATTTSARPLAILDIGAEASSFLVSGPNSLWFRTFALGGDDYSKLLLREFKLVRKQAEEAKRHPHRVRKLALLSAAWEPKLQQLRIECQRSLEQWKGLAATPQVGPLWQAADERSLEQWKGLAATALPARLLCCGGAAQTYGLVQMLRS